MNTINRQILLVSRPQGAASADNFRLVETPPVPLANPGLILRSRLTMQGFIEFEHPDAWPPALAELGELVATIAYGLERAPDAFPGLLRGRNFGKQLMQLV